MFNKTIITDYDILAADELDTLRSLLLILQIIYDLYITYNNDEKDNIDSLNSNGTNFAIGNNFYAVYNPMFFNINSDNEKLTDYTPADPYNPGALISYKG